MKPLSEIVKARRMRLTGHVLRQREDRSANDSHELDTRGRQETRRKSTKDLAYDVQRRSARFPSNIERCKEDRQ